MSPSWTLLSPLPREELDAVVEEAENALEHYRSEHGDEDYAGKIVSPVDVPAMAVLSASYRRFGGSFSEAQLKRYEACESALSIDAPGDLDKDRLQVAVLRFLL